MEMAGFNTFLSLDLPLFNDRYKTLMNPYRSAARVTESHRDLATGCHVTTHGILVGWLHMNQNGLTREQKILY